MKKNRNNLFIIMFSILIIALFLPLKIDKSKVETVAVSASGLWSDYAAQSFSFGDGTEENPYIISSAQELALMSNIINDRSGYYSAFKIVQDIDLQGHNWTPTGTFEGKLNGNGYNIKNLTIIDQALAGYYFMGLVTGNAQIKNINFTDVNFINNQNKIDAIALFNSSTGNANLDNIHILSGNYINNNLDGVGTIAGFISNGGDEAKINNCSTNLNITGSSTYAIGGFLGLSWSKFTNCYCYGTITTNKSRFVGGFAGQLYSMGLMENCFSKMNINLIGSVHEATGGLVGHLGYLGSTVIRATYYKGNFKSLYGQTNSYTEDKVYLNLNGLNDLPKDIWAVDDKINDGDPYLIARYWENINKYMKQKRSNLASSLL